MWRNKVKTKSGDNFMQRKSCGLINPFFGIFILCFVVLLPLVSGCRKNQIPENAAKKTIVVTYSALASVVKELAGDYFEVVSAVPNGLDPHEWEPSAKDMEVMTKAVLIVQNGLGLEGGMEKALSAAKDARVKFFTASDHITVRKVGSGEGIPSGDPDQAEGADDPHLWMDPVSVKSVILALGEYMKKEFSLDLSRQSASISEKLDALDAAIRKKVADIPKENRKLVTGHESLGYFARRYGFKLVGAIIPSLTSQAEESASGMAAIKKLVGENKVKVIFTELGTPPKVAQSLAKDAGVRCVDLATHSLPPDLSYFTFMTNLTKTITESLE
jgi:zinc/manganese transport system substrate-binding protein